MRSSSSIRCLAIFVALAWILVACFYYTHMTNQQSKFNPISDAEVTLPAKIDANEYLDALCTNYRKGKISGDLCNPLCYEKVWQIHSSHIGNKYALVLTLNGQKIVLKSSHINIEDYDRPTNESQAEFQSELLDLVNNQLEIGFPAVHLKHLIRLIWPPYNRRQRLTAADRTSIFALMQQDEYILLTVLTLSRVLPKVVGTCGHVYAVEYLVPFKMKTYYMNLRAKILVHLMGTLKLFYEFLNEPLQWCDVRFENFGLSADYPKRFMIMDLDYLFTESRLNHLFHNLKCRSDDDCVLNDCVSSCNVTSQRCTSRINDNVDIFCTKLVSALFSTSSTLKNNKYIAACQNKELTREQRLKDLRVVWAWSLADV